MIGRSCLLCPFSAAMRGNCVVNAIGIYDFGAIEIAVYAHKLVYNPNKPGVAYHLTVAAGCPETGGQHDAQMYNRHSTYAGVFYCLRGRQGTDHVRRGNAVRASPLAADQLIDDGGRLSALRRQQQGNRSTEAAGIL